jgi:hypothetical protein
MLMVQNPLTWHMEVVAEVVAWFFVITMVALWQELPIFSLSLCDVERAEFLMCRRAVKLDAEVGASKLMLESNCMGAIDVQAAEQ